jgi:2-succinyl-6-hydroxy-2,4-cyclohexadiene-1-carboxylate synthase
VTVDLPGHGQNARIKASLRETASLLAASLPDEPFILGGYSMGARTALHFALAYPERVRSLISLGGTRGIRDAKLRDERCAQDAGLAKRLRSEGTAQFLDWWLAQPLFATLPQSDQERQSRSQDAEGLATSLELSGTGQQRWLGDELSTLPMPALFLAGALDQKFAAEASALSEGVSLGSHVLVPNAGHAAHLEQPDAVAALITD